MFSQTKVPVLSHYVTTCSFWLRFNCSIKFPSEARFNLSHLMTTGRHRRPNEKEKSVSANVELKSLHVMHIKPNLDKRKIFGWQRNPLRILMMQFFFLTLIICDCFFESSLCDKLNLRKLIFIYAISIIKPYRLCSLEIYAAFVDDDGGLCSWCEAEMGSLDAQLILLPLHLSLDEYFQGLNYLKVYYFTSQRKHSGFGLRRVLASDAHRSIIMKTLHSLLTCFDVVAFISNKRRKIRCWNIRFSDYFSFMLLPLASFIHL